VRLALVAFAALALALVTGCTPSIGDKCTLSTDCSIQGDRLCDTSQPGGYCTIFNCTGNTCPVEAACVMFHPNVPGCPYDDRSGGTGARTARSFCVAQCHSNSDCRSGYVCADPRKDPWRALILDDVQTQLVCIPPDVALSSTSSGVDDTRVCQPGEPDWGPILDAGADAMIPGDAGD
jgi:hypothetical protein